MDFHSCVTLCFIIVFTLGTAIAQDSLPTVDLGYSIHQATFNETSNIYNFSNIYFASAPLFSKPRAINTVNRTVNTGQTAGICAQSTPWWLIASAQLADNSSDAALQQVNKTYGSMQPLYSSGNPSLESLAPYDFDPRTVQECLTLDVIVPKGTRDWETQSSRKNAPVIVWIFGGGYVSSDKNSAGDPSTLVSQSVNKNDPSDGVIFVSINYRLGMFGWLSGPNFGSQGGTSNLGLHDQRAGLEWIRQNIHHFGGDPKRITVMGESAGAASIMHHLTAFGGMKKAPFKQAIIQSPAFAPYTGQDTQDKNFQLVLKWASILNGSDVTTLHQLRKVPFEVLMKVNQISTTPAFWGTMTWAPAVDGVYVPKPAGLMLKQGLFDNSVKIITGHNSNEGAIFGSPIIDNEAQYMAYLQQLIPDATNSTLDHVNNVLYPSVFNGSQQYLTQGAREVRTITDSAFICNTRYIDLAYERHGAKGYVFDVAPGYHAQDLDYSFFNDGGTISGAYEVNVTLAQQMQRLFTNFAKTGSPDGDNVPTLPIYGKNSTLWSIQSGAPVLDNAATEQCDWWQEAHYLPRW